MNDFRNSFGTDGTFGPTFDLLEYLRLSGPLGGQGQHKTWLKTNMGTRPFWGFPLPEGRGTLVDGGSNRKADLNLATKEMNAKRR